MTFWTFWKLCLVHFKLFCRQLKKYHNLFDLTLPGPGWAKSAPTGIGHLLCYEGCTYELQTSWQFQLCSHWSPSKVILWISSKTFRKLTSNDINPRIFSIEKTKKWFFFIFFSKNTPNIISKLNDNFSEDFFEVLHILLGQKIKILENRPDFLTFSAKMRNRL